MILKKIHWVGSSLNDLKIFPKKVKSEIGFALHMVQEGKTPYIAKPLTGIGTGVMEIVSDYNKNTYRAVYIAKLGEQIYVLHAFQKKSKKGIQTPKYEIDLIRRRLIEARELAVLQKSVNSTLPAKQKKGEIYEC